MPLDRYALVAPVYDVLSGEWPVYRAGRTAGIRMLEVRPGDTVLDAGCGSGLSLPYLVDAVGPGGVVIALDASRQMLAAAARRVRRHGWSTVRLVRGDLAAASDALQSVLGDFSVDRAIATYALSVSRDPAAAWKGMVDTLRPGGTAVIVDMQRPTGAARVFGPIARAACALGGSDIDAVPWQWLERDGIGVRRTTVRGGHIVIVGGVV